VLFYLLWIIQKPEFIHCHLEDKVLVKSCQLFLVKVTRKNLRSKGDVKVITGKGKISCVFIQVFSHYRVDDREFLPFNGLFKQDEEPYEKP